MLDKLKLTVAAAMVVAGVWAYYALSESPAVVRLLVVVAGFLAGAAVGWFSDPGRRFVAFTRESLVEVKKVVWPTRKETVQTTATVFAFVVVMAVFLWIADKSLEWILYDLILGWKKA